MQSEHPADEALDVIRNGRVLGGLEPTRAFGDSRYKWPRAVQEVSVPPSLPRPTPAQRLTPALD